MVSARENNEEKYDVKTFLRDIQIIANKTIDKNSLIFIDEIQVSPRAIVMLHYLYEEKMIYSLLPLAHF